MWSAGLALIAVMATAYAIAPGDLLSSAAVGITTAVVLAMLSSLTLVPVVLVLFPACIRLVGHRAFGRARPARMHAPAIATEGAP